MVLWYNGKMLDTPNNLYRMTTGASIANSGLGANTLTKPVGTEVASIQPGTKYANYIASVASFTTSFNADVGQYTIFFYAKPNPGTVLTVAGNTVTYANNTFNMVNDTGESLSIPFRSHRAHLIVFTYSDLEAGLHVDGKGGVIHAATTDVTGALPVTLLEAGGILGDVYAFSKLLRTSEMRDLVSLYTTFLPEPAGTEMLSDSDRDSAFTNSLDDQHLLAGEVRTIQLEAIDCVAFKVEYELVGDAAVFINGFLAHSGIVIEDIPDEMVILATTDTYMSNVTLTEYINTLVSVGTVTITTDGSTGTPSPTHLHDDNAGTNTDAVVTVTTPLNFIGGWFKVANGSPMPGVTMTNGVLTGTGLYVDGKAYTGWTLQDWYFLGRNVAVTTEFTINVPVHSLTLSETTMTATQIDDLYESFFGNPVYTAPAEVMGLTENPAMIISSEWSIVASG